MNHAIPEDFDFKTEADKLILAVRFLADVDLESIRLSVNRAHTIAPIIDPTAYHQALHKGHMDDIARLAARCQPAVSAFKEIQANAVNISESI